MKKRKRKNRLNKKGWLLVISCCLIVAIPLGYLTLRHFTSKTENPDEPAIVTPEEPETENSLTLLVFGDLMFHQLQLDSAKTTTGYDFTESFMHIKEKVSAADIAFANFESTTNSNDNYKGYPVFNSPLEVFEAISTAGFDVLSTVNNHALDEGIEGVVQTIDAINNNGMQHVGTSKTADDHQIVYIEKNGITVAFLAYSYGFNGLETATSLAYVNSIDEALIESDIKTAKATADFVFTYFHWGVEYAEEVSSFQKSLAQKAISWGSDLIVGSHPHVVQGKEIIEQDGINHYVYYSLGNALSNQRRDTVDDLIGTRAKYTEDGLMVQFTITKNLDTQVTQVSAVENIPTWVYKYEEADGYHYEILIAKAVMEDNSLNLSEEVLDMITASYQHTLLMIGETADE